MKRYPIYPFCIAMFALLSLYASNLGQVRPGDLLRPAILLLALTFLVVAGFSLAMRNRHRGAIPAAVIVFFFLTYRYWVSAWWKISPPLNRSHSISDQRSILLLAGVICVWSIYAAARRVKHPTVWTERLNIFCIGVLACPLILVTVKTIVARMETPARVLLPSYPTFAHTLGAPPYHPDIYFIILDAHGRGDVLRDIYHYDDSPFLQHLRDRGFFVADKSVANYPFTHLSVTSALNYRYLDEFEGLSGVTWEPVLPLLRQSALVTTLKSLGYQWVAFDTPQIELRFRQADVYEAPPDRREITPFQELLVDATPISQMGGEKLKSRLTGGYADPYQFQRELTLYALAKAPEAARLPGAKFVFLHFLCPHPPFVFAADGSDPKRRGYGSLMDPGLFGPFDVDEYRDWYRDQVMFIDGQISGMIDKILANSAQPPVIVLISDHGPRSGVKWDNENPTDSDLHECLSNLTAVYIPKAFPSWGLDSRITPVNLFRVVLDDCLGQRLPLLPNKSYFCSPTPYAYHDVTAIVQPGSSTAPSAAGQ